jgi:hypothetical protein
METNLKFAEVLSRYISIPITGDCLFICVNTVYHVYYKILRAGGVKSCENPAMSHQINIYLLTELRLILVHNKLCYEIVFLIELLYLSYMKTKILLLNNFCTQILLDQDINF